MQQKMKKNLLASVIQCDNFRRHLSLRLTNSFWLFCWRRLYFFSLFYLLLSLLLALRYLISIPIKVYLDFYLILKILELYSKSFIIILALKMQSVFMKTAKSFKFMQFVSLCCVQKYYGLRSLYFVSKNHAYL